MRDVYGDWPRRRILGMVIAASRFGIDEASILQGTGIPPAALGESDTRLALDQEFAVARRLIELAPDLPVPLVAGRGFHWLAAGPVGQAVRTSRDLTRVHDLLWRAGRETGRDETLSLWLDYAVEPPHVHWRIRDRHLPADVRQFLTLRNLVYLDMGMRELLGRVVTPEDVAIRGPRPPYADVVDRHYGLEVRWDAPRTSLRVALADVSGELVAADPSAHARALAGDDAPVDLYPGGPVERDLVTETRRLLRGNGGPHTMESAAEALGVSSRTLRRHLALSGTSFRDLLSEELSIRARNLLAAGRPVQEVSRTLGYSEVAAFSRAFKRWTGSAPARWRTDGRHTSA